MLDQIANARESKVEEEDKIPIDVELLNTLTANSRYSFEREFTSNHEHETPWNSEVKSQT